MTATTIIRLYGFWVLGFGQKPIPHGSDKIPTAVMIIFGFQLYLIPIKWLRNWNKIELSNASSN